MSYDCASFSKAAAQPFVAADLHIQCEHRPTPSSQSTTGPLPTSINTGTDNETYLKDDRPFSWPYQINHLIPLNKRRVPDLINSADKLLNYHPLHLSTVYGA